MKKLVESIEKEIDFKFKKLEESIPSYLLRELIKIEDDVKTRWNLSYVNITVKKINEIEIDVSSLAPIDQVIEYLAHNYIGFAFGTEDKNSYKILVGLKNSILYDDREMSKYEELLKSASEFRDDNRGIAVIINKEPNNKVSLSILNQYYNKEDLIPYFKGYNIKEITKSNSFYLSKFILEL